MERSKIPMLSRFDTISHIMPYYGQTHWAFLLLSSLCSETRSKLDEFYDEFVTCMKENWIYIFKHTQLIKRLTNFFQTIYLKFLLNEEIKNWLTNLLTSLKTWETLKDGTLTVISCIQKLRLEILLELMLIISRNCILTLIYWNQHKWFYVKRTSITLKSNVSQALLIQITTIFLLIN